MEIHLNEVELHKAVENYIQDRGIDLSDSVIKVQLTAGRGQNGFYADVAIDEENTPAPVEESPFDTEPEVEVEVEVDEDQPGLNFDDD